MRVCANATARTVVELAQALFQRGQVQVTLIARVERRP